MDVEGSHHTSSLILDGKMDVKNDDDDNSDYGYFPELNELSLTIVNELLTLPKTKISK